MDSTYEQLDERLREALDDNAKLADEVERLRKGITRARLYAGDNLPAAAGTGIVQMLENTLKEAG